MFSRPATLCLPRLTRVPQLYSHPFALWTQARGVKTVSLSSFMKDIPISPRSMRPLIADEERPKLERVYKQRPHHSRRLDRRPLQLSPTPNHVLQQLPPIDETTRNAVETIRQDADQNHGRYYAIVEVNTMPYSVQQNDILITKRMPGTRVGDRLALVNVREIGTKNHFLRGQPCVDRRLVRVEAMVVEQNRSARYITYRRRLGRGPGDKKWKKRSHRDHLTYLRICNIQVGIEDDVIPGAGKSDVIQGESGTV